MLSPLPSRRTVLQAGLLSAVTVLYEPPPALAKQGGSVTVATVSANYREGLEALAAEYGRLHPNVRVKIQILPVNGYETWLRTQIPGGGDNAPDLFNSNYAWGLYERGVLVNMTPYVEAKNPYTNRLWKETLNAQFLEKSKIGGDVPYIPLDSIEIGFYYNADMLARLGIGVPRTWEEMLQSAERVRAAGKLPFAVPGNSDSYWSGTVGWVARFFSDAYTRHLVPMLLSQPGDWDYDPRKNRGFRLNLKDPYNDAYVVVNSERILNAILEGKIQFNSARFREAYQRMKEFSRYWQRGFHGASAQTAYHLFLSGRAAILLDTSQLIGQLLKDMTELPASARFRWGVFGVPPIQSSPLSLPAFRGVGGAGTMYSVVKKGEAQSRLAMDFLMFLSSPRSTQVLVKKALENRKPLLGPMLIPGTVIPAELKSHFRAFEGRGFERLSFRGLMDEQESSWEWTVWAQRYMEGRIEIDTFVREYQDLMRRAVPRYVAVQRLDLNPRTKDKR